MRIAFITGAAGSLGKILVKVYIDKGYMVRAFDIDEGGLADLKEQYGDFVRTIYGDITNYERIYSALGGSTILIHTAALKNIVITEDNPWETIKTNVKGTYNVVQACVAHNVRKAIFISSDKAVESTLLYGDSKAIGEKLWGWANKHSKDTRFSIIRSGNFRKSQGNVFETWDKQIKTCPIITLTDPQMERYFISMDDITKFIVLVEELMRGGEIFIPYMEQCSMHDLAEEYAKKHNCVINVIGARAGEKLIEKLYSQEESTRIEHHKDYMVINISEGEIIKWKKK